MFIKCDFCVQNVFPGCECLDVIGLRWPGGDAVCVSPTMVAVGAHRPEWAG